MANIHLILATVDGKRGRFFGDLSDAEFHALSEEIGGAMPRGFHAVHITHDEIQRGSKRVDLLKTYPLIVKTFSGTYADPIAAIRAAIKEEATQ